MFCPRLREFLETISSQDLKIKLVTKALTAGIDAVIMDRLISMPDQIAIDDADPRCKSEELYFQPRDTPTSRVITSVKSGDGGETIRGSYTCTNRGHELANVLQMLVCPN